VLSPVELEFVPVLSRELPNNPCKRGAISLDGFEELKRDNGKVF
jgi:hypothetical protein